jgi:hypothetical protein
MPNGVTIDRIGNIYIADAGYNDIRRVDAVTRIITTIAGRDSAGFYGDGGPATAALMNSPGFVRFDNKGNLYFVDQTNNRVRKIDTFGVITTVGGNGLTSDSTGNGGPATAAAISTYEGAICIDWKNDIYVYGGGGIRRIDSAGIIHGYAGAYWYAASAADGIPATEAWLVSGAMVIGRDSCIYYTDGNFARVRKIDHAGLVWSVAGDGIDGNSGNGGLADSAQLGIPAGLAFDSCGNLFFGEEENLDMRAVVFQPDCFLFPYLGVASRPSEIPVALSPNPAREWFSLAGVGQAGWLTLADCTGRTVAAYAAPFPERIHIGGLPSGLYFVNAFENGLPAKTLKLVINN